jgi:hypothetical protein
LTILLISNYYSFCVFLCSMNTYIQHKQHKLEADVYHFISSPNGLP